MHCANHPYMKEKFTSKWLERVQKAEMIYGVNVSTKSGTFIQYTVKSL